MWGNYSAAATPALTVHSGDTVVMQTLSTCGAPKGLMARGVAAADIPEYVQPTSITSRRPRIAGRAVIC